MNLPVGRVHPAQYVRNLPVALLPKSLMAVVFNDELGTANRECFRGRP